MKDHVRKVEALNELVNGYQEDLNFGEKRYDGRFSINLTINKSP